MAEPIYLTLSAIILIPLVILLYVPLRDCLKKPLIAALAVNIIFFILLILALPKLSGLFLGKNFMLVIFVLLAIFGIFLFFTAIDTLKIFVFFVWALGLISYSFSIAQAYALWNGFSSHDPRTLLLRISHSFIITLFFLIALRKKSNKIFLDTNVPDGFWFASMPIPLMFMYQNIILASYNSSMISTYYELTAFFSIAVGSFFLYFLLTGAFYTMANLYIDSSVLQEEKRILEFQKSQYDTITKDINNLNKLRHDIKHTVSMLKSLAKEDGSNKILTYLDDIDRLLLPSGVFNYCAHTPINSVLNYYSYRAKSLNVPIKLQIDLPEIIPIKDHEICSLIGNLMENAIDASILLPERERSFSFSMIKKGDNLMIVSSNTYNGELKISKNQFRSTKHSGMGVGIRSITETVKLYSGTIDIHHNEEEFFVDIMIDLAGIKKEHEKNRDY